MKIQKVSKMFLIVALVSPTLAFAKKLDVDPNHSAIAFEATHLELPRIGGRVEGLSI